MPTFYDDDEQERLFWAFEALDRAGDMLDDATLADELWWRMTLLYLESAEGSKHSLMACMAEAANDVAWDIIRLS